MKGKNNRISEYELEQMLSKIDLSSLPENQHALANAFALSLTSTLVGYTSSFTAGKLNVSSYRPMLNRSLFLGNQLSVMASPLLGVFFLGLFDWLVDLIKSLFDDEGVDVAMGTIQGPEGTPTHGGIGLELNIDLDEETTEPPSDFPFEFDKPPKEPNIKLKVMGIYNLDSALDSVPDFPPSGLDTLTFPMPGLEPGESGIGFGIEFKF